VEVPVPVGAGTAVTRVEVIDHIGQAFGAGPVTRSDLVAAAGHSGARSEVVAVLGRLPELNKFTRPHELWHDLADVPIDR
jgi:hypothetical protein